MVIDRFDYVDMPTESISLGKKCNMHYSYLNFDKEESRCIPCH
jgi:hypothetical protein